MGKISLVDRSIVITLHREGHSVRTIAQKTKVSKSTVGYIISKYKNTGLIEDKKRNGRPKKLSQSAEQYLKLCSLRNRKKSSRELAADLKRIRGINVDPSTVRRSLLRSGLRGCVARKKPLLRRNNKQKRLSYAREHNNWTFDEWSQVLWTDESKFELFSSNRRQYVRRHVGEAYQDECLQPTIKHRGGSLMIWDCFCAVGVGDLVRIDDKLTKERYKDILEHHAIPSGLRLIGQNFYLQQDHDPKHSSKLVQSYLGDRAEQGILKLIT